MMRLDNLVQGGGHVRSRHRKLCMFALDWRKVERRVSILVDKTPKNVLVVEPENISRYKSRKIFLRAPGLFYTGMSWSYSHEQGREKFLHMQGSFVNHL